MLLVFLPIIAFLGWHAWEVYKPQEDRRFVLAGKQWLVPKYYLVVLDGKGPEVSYFQTRLEYPDLYPRSPFKTPDDNMIIVTVKPRDPVYSTSVSNPILKTIKKHLK